jgi:quercetin dioxygenase-like cupin family protein
MTQQDLPHGVTLVRAFSGKVIDEPNNAAVVFPLGRFEEGASSTSITRVVIDGRHRKLASNRSVRLYFVLSGELTFFLGDGGPTRIATGDLLSIPRGCPYSLEGHAEYLVMNSPAFEEDDDYYFE